MVNYAEIWKPVGFSKLLTSLKGGYSENPKQLIWVSGETSYYGAHIMFSYINNKVFIFIYLIIIKKLVR